VEDGVLKVNYKPKEKVPIVEWLKVQGRFKHLFKAGGEELLAAAQADIDKNWERLLDFDGKAIY